MLDMAKKPGFAGISLLQMPDAGASSPAPRGPDGRFATIFTKGANMTIIDKIEQEQLKKDITPFNVGDTVKVHCRVVEGGKERIQMYEGLVIARRGSGVNSAFTVRKISYGEGVERVFPLHSPRIAKIEVLNRGKVRRAKLHYLRNRVGKRALLVKSAN